jgi:hypothetical protein
MDSTPHDEIARRAALRAAAVACGPGSVLQATSAAPLWRALSDQSALWVLAPLPQSARAEARRGFVISREG